MNPANTTLLNPQPPLLPLTRRPFFHHTPLTFSLPRPSFIPTRATTSPPPTPTPTPAPAPAEVNMVLGRDGIWTAREQKVVVLWDLDNKPPRGPPFEAALALRRLAETCGRVVDISAYANRHAFIHLPQWVADQRRERRHLDILERKGLAGSTDPYICGVCGRKCRTNLDLKKHFRQLHERERQKKLDRMRSLKGKKRQKYRERFVSGNHKYEEAARSLLSPKIGYGLAPELRRAGVFVKTVEDKPQAADAALKRQMQHSMARGIDWLFLVSDDSDFSDMIRRAREAGLRTVVVGDGRRALGGHADIWVPWIGVENGEVGEEMLLSQRTEIHEDSDDGEDEDSLYSASFDEGSDYEDSDVRYLDDIVEEIAVGDSGLDVRISAFSEEDGIFQTFGSSLPTKDLLWDSDEEEDDYL